MNILNPDCHHTLYQILEEQIIKLSFGLVYVHESERVRELILISVIIQKF